MTSNDYVIKINVEIL